MSTRRTFIATTAAATAAVLLAGTLVLGGGHESVAATARPAPEARVAKRFLDAYGRYQTDRALKLLTSEALETGAGNSHSWGSRDAFRREVSLARAWHVKQTVTGCEQQGKAAEGVVVRCAFDYHALRSDEVGLGPYRDNYWELVVRNGKITAAKATWAYLTNGFSAQRWEPFQAWVASTHPEDLQTMYPVGDPQITEEAIRLWDKRSKEWVAAVKASAA
jgi:hypothetical protein